MSLSAWLADGVIKSQESNRTEISRLLAVVDRDLTDASVPGLSVDRGFATAYEAGLQLATIVLRASGYRASASAGGHHWRTIALLTELMGPTADARAISTHADALGTRPTTTAPKWSRSMNWPSCCDGSLAVTGSGFPTTRLLGQRPAPARRHDRPLRVATPTAQRRERWSPTRAISSTRSPVCRSRAIVRLPAAGVSGP